VITVLAPAKQRERQDSKASNLLPISVVVLTYNEERNIAECLQSVRDWAGEIFVVDSGSKDRTLEIAREFTANIISHRFEDYSRQRNWAQDNLPLCHDWVFHIDADERVTSELESSLRDFFQEGKDREVDGLLISRRTVFLGRPILHGGHYPAYHARLFRRNRGRCEERRYDQHFVVEGVNRKVAGDLIDVITSDLTVWLVRHARWGAAEAQEEFELAGRNGAHQVRGRLLGTPIQRRRWLRSSVYGRAPLFFRAFAYFAYRYFLRLGFLDGCEGLIFHFLQGCSFRFYIDAKIYEARKAAAATQPGRSKATLEAWQDGTAMKKPS
jgi:glycosyltransferase involved in cell wall biosynthesis